MHAEVTESAAPLDNILAHSEDDMAKFRQLCREAHVVNSTAPMAKCRYVRSHPLLVLRPQPVEHVLPGTVIDTKVGWC